ncbi:MULTISPECIES: glycosyltransferase [unclassified Modestobacter]|uniref:glycosyltransferase n=1 Tax=unclassified Modestobacter TaxID=2643866 RepID=UPI0022A9F74F|nr:MULTISPECIES: glycosyltransferase [unclassified Modestobacter]MCZ2825576.1 glycosyltransferase [Modestobacter sp. VKM Ac-2981]MCZ2853359.1 glycosyltransferase [Modestobacter sp. VKM Ac-2982]
MKVAIAHDYLTQRGGAERVVLSMVKAFPDAEVHTLLYDPATTFSEFADVRVRTSRLNDVGFLRRDHRRALPLLPFAASRLKIDADVVLASTSGWAHGFDTGNATLVAYCYSPARWLYQHDRYLGENPPRLRSIGLQALRRPLIAWDKRAAQRVDHYLAISTVVQQRIYDVYGKTSTLVPAPLSGFASGARARPAELSDHLVRGGFHLCVSRLLPYKNVRQVLEAARIAGVNLVIVGKGSEAESLRMAAGQRGQVLSDLSDAEVAWLYARCDALIAASYEDFGLTPLEAAVHGKPSIALRFGGFLDTMIEGVTGVFFDEPTPELIAVAIGRARDVVWSGEAIKARAAEFSEDRYIDRLHSAVHAAATARNAVQGLPG